MAAPQPQMATSIVNLSSEPWEGLMLCLRDASHLQVMSGIASLSDSTSRGEYLSVWNR
jgi:hypothetical protein